MKCKFRKICKYYDKDSAVCTKNGGGYYEEDFGFRPAGCYREIEKKTKGGD